MPTPQQQAAAAIKADITLQLETIRLAKKATLDAFKKQKAESQVVYKLAKQLLAQQIAAEKQSAIETKTPALDNFQADRQPVDQQQEVTVVATAIEEDDGAVTEADPQVGVAETGNISFAQSAAQTIGQLQFEVSQACQTIQMELAQTIQQLGNNIDAN